MTENFNIFITGMMCSGVQDIADFLVCCGLHFPELGNERIRQINTDLLDSLNSHRDLPDIEKISQINWYHPPSTCFHSIQNILESGRFEKNLILADPAFCFTSRYWISSSTAEHFLIVVRHPLDIAQCLEEEYGFSFQKSIRLWETYYWALFRSVPLEKCVFVSYELFENDVPLFYSQLYKKLSVIGLELTNCSGLNTGAPSHQTIDSAREQYRNKLTSEQLVLWGKLKELSVGDRTDERDGFISHGRRLVKTCLTLLSLASSPAELRSVLRGIRQLKKQPAYFDRKFYISKNPDVAIAGIDPLVHFLVKGRRENRNPNHFFDVFYYLENNPDVRLAGVNPLLHYIETGWKENRSICSEDDLKRLYSMVQREKDDNLDSLVKLHREGEILRTFRQLNERIEFIARNDRLTRQVTVIVPVYLANEEGIRVFRLLLDSLSLSYSQVNPLLNFIFLDDCSPLQDVEMYLREYNMLERNDVRLIINKENLGFVKTVNAGFALTGSQSDVVILNSDTEIHGPVFEILQNNCFRYKDIASVTPLSNRAVLSSLVCWPEGYDSVFNIEPSRAAQIVFETGLKMPNNYVPTGHGFCMYMSKEALELTGGFDAEKFGQGYGEENDWSVRTIKAGYRHLISTECYVHHHESRSFGNDQKDMLKKKNAAILSQLHQNYDFWVLHYLKNDPLKNHRKVLQLFLLEEIKRQKQLKTICFFLHDSFNNPYGGVQRYTRQLISHLQNYGLMEVLVISPTELESDFYEIYFQQEEKKGVIEHLDVSSLLNILEKFEKRIDYIHLHNTFGVNENLLNWIKRADGIKKLYSVHDYALFCLNPFLLDKNEQFCLKTKRQFCHGGCSNIADDAAAFLSCFDTIIVPSENCFENVQNLISHKQVISKLTVLPHFLDYIPDVIQSSGELRKSLSGKNVVFLGALYPHKGGNIFLEAVPELIENGCNSMIWGTVQQALVEKHKTIPAVESYHDHQSLCELQTKFCADVIVMPSVCAETFSYTLYEALILLGLPVVVGEHGHPADIVREYGVGEIVQNNCVEGLAKAVLSVLQSPELYKNKIRSFIDHIRHFHTPDTYLKQYLKILDINNSNAHLELPRKSKAASYSTICCSEEARDIYTQALEIDQKRPLKVMMVHALGSGNPPYFYRFENPAEYLKKYGCTVIENAQENIVDELPDDADLLYLSRTPMDSNLSALIEKAQKHNIPIVLDVDDLLFHEEFLNDFYFLGRDEEHKSQYRKLVTGIAKTLERSDILLGSTPQIAEEGEKLGKTSLYFRNRLLVKHGQLFVKLFKERPAFKKKVIGYFSGSNTHDKDLDSISSVIETTLRKYPDVELLVMGFVENVGYFNRFKDRINILPFGTYEEYLRALQVCKVVVAPLSEINRFTNAKSNIKFMEAAVVGTPVIASMSREMSASITNGVNGWLASSNSEWQQAIDDALFEDFAECAGVMANSDVKSHYGDECEKFYKLLQAICYSRYVS